MSIFRKLVQIAALLLTPTVQTQPVTPPDLDDPPPLAFKIAPSVNQGTSGPGTRSFIATFGTGDDEAKFIIELGGSRVAAVGENGKPPPDGIDVSYSRGVFRHVDGSKPAAFLKKLAYVLQARAPKYSVEKSQEVPFDLAILGVASGRAPDGGFNNEAGNWITTKLFLGKDEAEVYFNFNAVSGDAEFSIKDEEYGNEIVEALSKVVW